MALRIIDLDIDESLSADTRVAEVGWVFQPAIEIELMYFSKTRLNKKQYARVKEFIQKMTEKLEYEPGVLPDYVNYATGDTKDNMLTKPVLFVERQPGESKDDYISRCVEYHIKNEGMKADQAYAICISATEKFYKGEKVSFDFDDTLSTARGYGLALHEKFLGAELYIISARRDKAPMLKVADKLGIPHDRVFATGSNLNKIQKIKELNINRHFDNNEEVINSLGNRGVQFSCPCLDGMVEMGVEINGMIEEFGLMGFIDGEPVFSTPDEAAMYGEEEHGCSGHHVHKDENGNELYMACATHPEDFASYNDYPKEASENACKVLKWIDEYGRDEVDGMTETGLTRANQLCNRENISEETIGRMAAFERHRENSTIAPEYKGTPWKDKGYVAWLGWGGDAGVEWASRKLEQIKREDFAEVGERGGIKESDKAPKSDTPNKDPKGEGSAKGDASTTRGAEVSQRVEDILKEKSDDFNERYKEKLGYGVNVGMLKSVYQRGVGAYNVSHSPEVKSAEQWALARVNAFLYLVKEGRPENSKYTGDYDLLPTDHPKREEMSYGFGVDEYTEEEIETVKLLQFLAETDYEQFEAVVGSMRGATEQEIYRRNHKNPTIYFQYERVLSGSPDRDFCMSIENRYFRRLEIDLLRDTNREFGHEQQPYSKWLYKGGPNCVHAWRKFLFQGNIKADQGMADGTAGRAPKELPNNGYYSPETKRKSEVAYIVSQQNMSKQVFKADNEQRMIYTPLMLPNILIPRNDGDGEIYFVRFKPEVIEKIRNKFMIEGRLRASNYEHSDQKFNDIVMVESWIVKSPQDQAYSLGFTQEQVPIGSWMGGYKVLETEEGDIIWNDYIKSGKVKGASVEGEFLLRFSKEDMLLEEIFDILNKVVD